MIFLNVVENGFTYWSYTIIPRHKTIPCRIPVLKTN